MLAVQNFVLPMTKDDLLSCNSPGDRYSVQQVYSEKDVYKKLHDVTRAFDGAEPSADFVLEHFDSFFSALFHFHRIDDSTRRRSWYLLFRVCSQFKDSLVCALRGDMEDGGRATCCNALKMLMYLLTQHVVYFENLLDKKNSKEEKKLIKPKGGSKKSRASIQVHVGGLEFNWEEQAAAAMTLIHNILLLPVQKLWATPLVEEQFVNLVGNCCYKLLDDPDIHLVKMKALRDLVFDILGLLIKYHVHTPTFIMTLVKLLTSSEHLSSALARGVIVLVHKYHQQGLVRSLINEIIHHGLAEFGKENSVAARAYSEFLVCLAEGDPAIMMSSIKILMPLLDQDPYQLRNCVLSVLAEVLVQDLKQPGGSGNEEERLEQREEIYENLEEHFHDSNAFVRSKVCQIWQRLLLAEAVPPSRHSQLLELAVGRLGDKSLYVRKSALQVVTAFLDKYHYVAQIGVEAVQAQMKDERARLCKMEMRSRTLQLDQQSQHFWNEIDEELTQFILNNLQAGSVEVADQGLQAAEILLAVEQCHDYLQQRKFLQAFAELRRCEPQTQSEHSTIGVPLLERVGLYKMLMQRILFARRPTEGSSQVLTESQTLDSTLSNPFAYINVAEKDLSKARVTLTFLQASVGVGQQLQAAVAAVHALLFSPVTSDILAAVDFLTVAHTQRLTGISSCLQDMLSLVWHPEMAVRATVADSFRAIYLAPLIPDYKERAVMAVDNLSVLVQTSMPLHQKVTLDKLLVSWMDKEYIDYASLLVLWARYNMADQTSAEDSLAAAKLLSMLGRCEKQRNMIKNNTDNLIKVGFGERGTADFRLVFYTCQILSSLSPNKPSTDTPFFRLRSDHSMFTAVASILVKGLSNVEDSQYIPMATEALNLIFKLSQDPDKKGQQILIDLLDVFRKELDAVIKKTTVGNSEGEVSVGKLKQQRRSIPIMLARLLHCVGHVGLLLFHYIDKDVYVEMKRRQTATTEETNRKREAAKRRRSASHVIIRPSAVTEAGSEDELEGAMAEDEDAEIIRSVCDKQLLAPTCLLGSFSRLVETMVDPSEIFQNADLHSSASLAVGSLMAVSTSYCDKRRACLEQAANQVARSNTVLLLRDLTFRFPTLMEPHTQHLYARLCDGSREVRGNAMTALSSLILTEMVKAKSNISQLARCIVDEDQDMVQRAKELFSMMSQKGNQLYNALPDIISKLSSPQEEVREEDYHIIMTCIMSLIHKDRQHELLVEKLCARFRLSESERQWRDLAFCLSLLAYNERSLRKLLDNMPLYADKLQHEPVYKYMLTISEQAAKQAKPEMKLLLEELDQRLSNCKEKGIDDGTYAQSAKPPPKSAKKPDRSKESARKKRDKKCGRTSTSESDDESLPNQIENEGKSNAKSATKRPAKISAKASVRRPSKTPAKRPVRQKTNQRRVDTSSDESSGQEN